MEYGICRLFLVFVSLTRSRSFALASSSFRCLRFCVYFDEGGFRGTVTAGEAKKARGEHSTEKFLISHLHTMRQLRGEIRVIPPRRRQRSSPSEKLSVEMSFAFFAQFSCSIYISATFKERRRINWCADRRSCSAVTHSPPQRDPPRLCLYIRGGSHYLTKQQKR